MTVHTLSEILRLGRQHDPDGVEVVMSRQACEEAAHQIETLAAYQQRAERLFECLQGLEYRVSVSAVSRNPLDIDDSFLMDARELLSECKSLTALEGFAPAKGANENG